MVPDLQSEVTTLLEEIRAGNEEARHRLAERIYGELREVAAGLMRGEPAGHTLQPTALLHEAFARLIGAGVLGEAPNRAYLFGAAARAMREVLVDHARRRQADKRGAGRSRLPLDAVLAYFEEQDLDVVALHEALDRLADFHERQSQVVTLRFFAGMTVPEVAQELGVSISTVEADFRIARAWLRQQLSGKREGRP
jgi:RNA polymerase sigma factor (TIGR02999 family)